MIVDIHAHLVPKQYLAEEHLKVMSEFSIDKSVVVAAAWGLLSFDDFSKANDFILTDSSSFLGVLIPFAVINPLHGGMALEEMDRRVAEGFKGFKLLPHKHGAYTVDSPLVDPLIEKAVELDVPVFVHTDFNNNFCTPYQLVQLARRHPKAKLIMGHMGIDPEMIRFVPHLVKEAKNLYLDISCTPDMPELVIAKPVQVLGSHRILFGTDLPELHAMLAIKKVELAKIRAQDKENILGINACRLLQLQ